MNLQSEASEAGVEEVESVEAVEAVEAIEAQWEIFRVNLKIKQFGLLSKLSKVDGPVKILFKLYDVPSFTIDVKVKDSKVLLGPEKSILFPAVEGNRVALDSLLFISDKLRGVVTIYFDDVLYCLEPGQPEVFDCGVEFKEPNSEEHVALMSLNVSLTRLGFYTEEEDADVLLKKTEVEDERNKVLFKSNEKDPKIHIELRAPRRKAQPIIPPYHEDIGVQTIAQKTKKKKKK